jgi:hypothetical protein
LPLPGGLLPKVEFSSDAAQLQFTNNANLAAYFVVNESGFDRKLPDQVIKNGMEILREYTDLAGKPIKTVKIGQELQVHLRFRSLERQLVQDVALVDLLPGGFEVVLEPKTQSISESSSSDSNAVSGEGEGDSQSSDRMNADTGTGWSSPLGSTGSGWQPDYADVREDRVVIYGSVSNKLQEYTYRIRATNTGGFVVPPAHGESMYERNIQARSLADKLTVEKK